MCGIAGIILKNQPTGVGEEDLRLLKEMIAHRGPDDYGSFSGSGSGFLNVRLSIVDIQSGHQPIYSADKSVGIVYNGEVYNHQELRRILEKRGYRFQTQSDTEVVLAFYQEFGVESFSKLNGMFAFCIWDEREETVYLVRDQLGIKPLYVYEDGEQIVFSSELKGLIGFPDLDLGLNAAGVQDYLTFRYTQSPFTVFKQIKRLEAGTYLKVKHGSMSQHRYWELSFTDSYPAISMADAKEELHRLMLESVRSQLMGEVPIGALLSGGVDSSAITYFVHKLGANLTTYNIGFPEVNEFEYSRVVAEAFGLRHVEVLTTVDELLANLDNVILALDEPLADPACLPLYQLARELKKSVTVVLSGEGGDELFAGYPQYEQVLKEGRPSAERFQYFLANSWYFQDISEFLVDTRIPPHQLRFRKYFEEVTPLAGMLSYDLKTWLPEDLMMKADKILMAHSLEGRFPFLDQNLLRFACSLPDELKLPSHGPSKWILKELMADKLPAEIINRPKMGFSVPVPELVQRLKPLMFDVLNDGGIRNLESVLNLPRVKAYFENFFKTGAGHPLQIWTMFIFLYWHSFAVPHYQARQQKVKVEELPSIR